MLNKKQKNFSNLKKKIINHEASVGIIGLGYVGLPLVLRFAEKKFNVIGFDVDKKKIKLLNKSKSYIKHIDPIKIDSAIKNNFFATSDFSNIKNVNVIIICVPTPLGAHNEPDLSFIYKTMESIAPHLEDGQLLVLESTTYPGTTDEEIVPIIKKSKFTSEKNVVIGSNFFVGYSPEREDPGNKDFTTATIPKIVSGVSENCLELVKLI